MLFSRKEDVDFLSLLVKAAQNTVEASHLFRVAMKGDKPPAEYFHAIKELETKGDRISRDVFNGLNKVFITPIDREDIMELASTLDEVIDGIEATIARFDYLAVEQTDKYMKDFAEVIVASCQHILDAFKLLSKKKYLQLTQHTQQIKALENEGDRLMREGIREVFHNKRDVYEDFKLKEIYERLEQTTDACEDVADILHSVVLRYS